MMLPSLAVKKTRNRLALGFLFDRSKLALLLQKKEADNFPKSQTILRQFVHVRLLRNQYVLLKI